MQEEQETKPESQDTDPASPAPDLQDTIIRLNSEVQELKDKYLRAFAEMENMRRRQERERIDLVKYALENAFKDLLPVLDSLETALPETAAQDATNADSEASFRAGILMVKRQFIEVLKRHGLEAIKSAGEPFDPNLHQAIQRIDSKDIDGETVGSEFAKGYLLNGRLLRPAMVSVLIPSGS